MYIIQSNTKIHFGNKVLTINYSLDNYVAVYYNVKDISYQSRAGYLEIIPENKEGFLENLDTDTKKYYEEAWSFTEWFNGVLDDINLQETNALKITRSNGNSALPEATSSFNDEKYKVIMDSVTDNLIQSMYVYGRNTDRDFQMPKLTGDDWATILNNVCFVAFLQGLPVGTTIYNDYVIISSSENKEIASENLINYVNVDSNGNAIGSYHRAWCPHLLANEKIVRI